MNPLSRLLAGVLAVVALLGAFFFGIFVLALAVGIGLVAWLVLWLRMWWLARKKPRRDHRPSSMKETNRTAQRKAAQRGGDVIDAEYEVVSREEDD